MSQGNIPQKYVWEFAGNPTNASLSIINPPKGALVIDNATGNLYRKTTGYGDNSGFALFTAAAATTITYASTITPNSGVTQIANVGTLTGDITISNPTGTPTDGQILRFRLAQDSSGSHAITWGAGYAFGTDVTAALIPSTASAKWEMVFEWNAADSKWRAVGIARGF